MQRLFKGKRRMPMTIKNRFCSWLIFLCALCAVSSTLPALTQDGPVVQTLTVSCANRHAAQHGLKRPRADGNAWSFNFTVTGGTIRPGTLKWTVNDGGQGHTLPAGVATGWGTFVQQDNGGVVWDGSLNPDADSSFTVTATGKLDCGGGGGGDGAGDDSFEVTWDGTVAAPPPDDKKCPPGDPVNTCTVCPCGQTDIITTDTSAPTIDFHTDPAAGPGVRFSLAQSASTHTWSISADCNLTTDADGNVTLTQANGCHTTFHKNADGSFTSETGDQRTLVDMGGGNYDLVPQGGGETFHFRKREGQDAGTPVLLDEETDAYGNTLTYTRDADGRLTGTTDATGHTTTLSYDANGRLSQIVDDAGHTQTYTYDANGRLASQTDISGQTISYQYDSLGRVTQMTNALGTTRYTYEGATDASGGTDGGETGYSAPGDAMGYARRTTIEYPDGGKEEFFYDGYGNTTHVAPEDYVAYTDATHNNASSDVPKTTTKTEMIGGQARITQETSPSGALTKTEYDAVTGLPTKVTAPDGTVVSTTYNAQGNPLVVTGPDGKTTTLEYAANGVDVTKVKDAEGHTVGTFTYNAQHAC